MILGKYLGNEKTLALAGAVVTARLQEILESVNPDRTAAIKQTNLTLLEAHRALAVDAGAVRGSDILARFDRSIRFIGADGANDKDGDENVAWDCV